MKATVGIDVGGSRLKAVVRGAGGEIEARMDRQSPPDAAALIQTLIDVANQVGPGLSVGVGLAGLVDHVGGTLVWSPHLPGTNVPVAADLDQHLGVGVVVDNDANLAGLAEQREGAGRGAGVVLMVTLGTGIGMGLVVDGRIYRGRGHAGEVGHVTADPQGEVCACGRSGCWETMVSGRRLDTDAAALLGAGSTASDLVAAAATGDDQAGKLVDRAARALAMGLEVAVLALDPEMIVVGGALAAAGDLLLEPSRRRLSTTEGAGHRPDTTVTAGILGPYAGAIGAAILAAERESTHE